MSFVNTAPDLLVAAASDLTGIGSTISAANAAAGVPTTQLLAAGADDVSEAIASWFTAHAQGYQALSARVQLFHTEFVQALRAGAGSYAATELANSPLLDALNAPFLAAIGRPLIGDGADATLAGAPGQNGGLL